VLVELEKRYAGDAPPALDDDAAALARIEARYRDRSKARTRVGRTGRSMATIPADPDDRPPRRVRDWLGERGIRAAS
jgi:hypothetical protein